MKRLGPGRYVDRRMIGGHEHSCEVYRNVDTGRWHWRLKNTGTGEVVVPASREWPSMADARQDLAQAMSRNSAEATEA